VTNKYPASYLWTNVAELIHEFGIKAEVHDVRNFGYLPEENSAGAVFIEVFTRDSEGKKTGTVRHTRWIEFDVSYPDWGNPPQ